MLHLLIAVDTLRQKTPTVDEVAHLPAGISYLQKGTFELYHHNPPLVKMLAGAAALTANPTVDYSKNVRFWPKAALCGAKSPRPPSQRGSKPPLTLILSPAGRG